MNVGESEVGQVITAVWSTMLGFEVETGPCGDAPFAGGLAGAIGIEGTFRGEVLLELDPDLARACAHAMLRLPAGTATPRDAADTASELINVIGGNLKSVLPAPSKLQLPQTGAVGTLLPCSSGQRRLACVEFRCAHGRGRVSLYAMD